jgi:hypothetical protein
MRERHEARSRSFDALQKSLDDSKSRAFKRKPKKDQQELITQRTWLQALETEVQQEKVI